MTNNEGIFAGKIKLITAVLAFVITLTGSVWGAREVLATKEDLKELGTTLVQYINTNRQLLDANSTKTNIVNNIRNITTQIQDLKNLRRKHPNDDEIKQDLADAKDRLRREENNLNIVDKEIKAILTPK